MARIIVPSVRIRTTSDGKGIPLGVCVGTGTSPMLALADLQQKGQAAAEELIAQESSAEELAAGQEAAEAGAGDGVSGPGPDVGYEVVGVLLTSGLLEGGFPGWCAYGTLRTIG
jgi:hypothetical protein